MLHARTGAPQVSAIEKPSARGLSAISAPRGEDVRTYYDARAQTGGQMDQSRQSPAIFLSIVEQQG